MGRFMEYEEFKTAVKRDLPVYLPLNLRNRQIGEQTVYKVNQKLDGVHLIPKEQPVGMEREAEKNCKRTRYHQSVMAGGIFVPIFN